MFCFCVCFVVTAIKFAHDDKYHLACSSTDGTLSVCALVPSPPSVTCTLRGHKAAVMGRYKIVDTGSFKTVSNAIVLAFYIEAVWACCIFLLHKQAK